jgi:hypothetical protein
VPTGARRVCLRERGARVRRRGDVRLGPMPWQGRLRLPRGARHVRSFDRRARRRVRRRRRAHDLHERRPTRAPLPQRKARDRLRVPHVRLPRLREACRMHASLRQRGRALHDGRRHRVRRGRTLAPRVPRKGRGEEPPLPRQERLQRSAEPRLRRHPREPRRSLHPVGPDRLLRGRDDRARLPERPLHHVALVPEGRLPRRERRAETDLVQAA